MNGAPDPGPGAIDNVTDQMQKVLTADAEDDLLRRPQLRVPAVRVHSSWAAKFYASARCQFTGMDQGMAETALGQDGYYDEQRNRRKVLEQQDAEGHAPAGRLQLELVAKLLDGDCSGDIASAPPTISAAGRGRPSSQAMTPPKRFRHRPAIHPARSRSA